MQINCKYLCRTFLIKKETVNICKGNDCKRIAHKSIFMLPVFEPIESDKSDRYDTWDVADDDVVHDEAAVVGNLFDATNDLNVVKSFFFLCNHS